MSPCHTALVSIDGDGVLRTVALPDPTDVMTEQFRVGLDSIIAIHRDPLRELVESALMRVYQRGWSHQRRQKATSGRLHLPDVLQDEVMAPEDVARAIDEVESRWRLDAISALEDYIEWGHAVNRSSADASWVAEAM